MGKREGRSTLVGRAGVAVLLLLLIGALLSPAAMAQVTTSGGKADFSGYATGATAHLDLLTTGTTRLEDTEVAFSGAAVNSNGLGSQLVNETNTTVVPSNKGDKNAYARGSGLEVGLLTPTPVSANQIILAQKAEADALPNVAAVRKEIGPVDLNPIAFASLLRGEAAAKWAANACVLGADISRGLGYAANAQLVESAANPATQEFDAPLVATETNLPEERKVSQSLSRTRLVPQTDSSGNVIGSNLGLMSEVRETIAPVSLLGGQFTLEIAGEWVLRSVATGVNNGAYVFYGPGSVSPSTPVLRLLNNVGAELISVTTQQLLGSTGLVVPLPAGIGEIALGEDPRQIGGNAASQPTVAGDGTEASAAVDVARVTLNVPGVGQVTDLRVGHMETSARVPAGGVVCPIPVTKTAPDTVNIGDTFDFLITVNNPFDCTLTDLRVEDTIAASRGVRFTIVGTDPTANSTAGGKVVWENLGSLAPGESKTLKLSVRIDSGSLSGQLTDTVVATANCGLGGAQGGTTINTPLRGTFVLNAPRVGRGPLPVTGGPVWYYLGGALLLGVGGTALLRRSQRMLAATRV